MFNEATTCSRPWTYSNEQETGCYPQGAYTGIGEKHPPTPFWILSLSIKLQKWSRCFTDCILNRSAWTSTSLLNTNALLFFLIGMSGLCTVSCGKTNLFFKMSDNHWSKWPLDTIPVLQFCLLWCFILILLICFFFLPCLEFHGDVLKSKLIHGGLKNQSQTQMTA